MATAYSLLEVQSGDGIVRLSINRPSANNGLNPAVVFQLHQAFREAIASAEVRGVVIGGVGKAFVAGADLDFFLRNLEAGSIDRIIRFTAAGHALLDDIDRAPKPVVACVHGLALGGGLELALACHQIFVTSRASLGLPETALGIYPGLGGTLRMPRKIGVGLAKWLIYTGKIISATEAQTIGLADQLVPEENLQAAARKAILTRCSPEPQPSRSPEMLALETFFQTHTVTNLLFGTASTAGDPRLIGAMRRVRANAPIALKMAERLIDEGITRPPVEAMRLVLDRLPEIFATHDAYEGISAAGKRQPVFQGC
jgi:enoyl-CoA hydratase/carnithine racemase